MSTRLPSGVTLGRLPGACGIFSLAAGTIGVSAWVPGFPVLWALHERLGLMKLNTAICLQLAGGALLLQRRASSRGAARWVARIAAAVVVAAAVVTLLEPAIGRDLIDRALAEDPLEVISAPGRMSPLVAVAFGCVGIALIALDAARFAWMTRALALIAGTLGLLALIGFTLGATAFYRISDFTRVAPGTALTLCVLAAGLLAARPSPAVTSLIASHTPAGLMARRLLPAAVLVPTMVGWLILLVYRRGLASTEAAVAGQVLTTILIALPVVAWTSRSTLALDAERARIEHELRVGEARFRAVAEGAREAIVSADAQGRITYVNPGATTMFGYAPGEALGQPLALLMPRDPMVGGRAGSHGEGSGPARPALGRLREATGLRKDGQELAVELSLSTWAGDGEGDARTTAIIRDVSERKRAERERQRLASIVESSADAIFSTTLEGTIITWNHAAERIFAYPAAEIVGESVRKLVPEARLGECEEILRRVARGERVDLAETVRMARGGRLVPVWISAAPLEDAAGQVVGISGILRDLSERNQARAERDRFFTVSHDLLCVADADERLRRVNPAFLHTLGYTEADVLGRSFVSFVHPEDVAGAVGALAGLRAGARAASLTCRFRARGGADHSLAWVFTADAEHGLYAAARDVTEALAAERRLVDALAEKEVLLKEIHHRVKNNLQIISSLLSFQSRQLSDPAALAAFRESQDRVRAMALFHERLYQARDLAQVQLVEVLRQMAEMLRHTYRLGGAEIALHVRGEGVHVGVDAAVPCGLIANELVTNSLKYAFPAGRAGRIDIELAGREGGGFTFVVADDGVGLPEGVDPARSPSLGLRLVTALCEQMDATLAVERGAGRVGTRFEVTVPPGGAT